MPAIAKLLKGLATGVDPKSLIRQHGEQVKGDDLKGRNNSTIRGFYNF